MAKRSCKAVLLLSLLAMLSLTACNGNWWIGDEDTGVKAEGQDGTHGTNGTDGKMSLVLKTSTFNMAMITMVRKLLFLLLHIQMEQQKLLK